MRIDVIKKALTEKVTVRTGTKDAEPEVVVTSKPQEQPSEKPAEATATDTAKK